MKKCLKMLIVLFSLGCSLFVIPSASLSQGLPEWTNDLVKTFPNIDLDVASDMIAIH